MTSKSGFRNLKNEMLTEQFVEFLAEELSPFGIEFSHPFDVAQEKSFRYESSEGCLINGGRVLIHYATDLGYGIYQLLWCNEIAQPQGGIKNFTHRSRVDDSTGIIKSLQTWQGRTSKAEFGVVIVLQDESIAERAQSR